MTTQVESCSWKSELNHNYNCVEREVEGLTFLDWSERRMGRGKGSKIEGNTRSKKE